MAATLPVLLQDGLGTTRDVSPSGLYFETDAAYSAGSVIAFSVDFDTPGGKMVLQCRGEVVRVEQHMGRLGVGVRIMESTLHAGMPAEPAAFGTSTPARPPLQQ